MRISKEKKIDQSIHNDFDDRFTIIKRDREKGDEDSKSGRNAFQEKSKMKLTPLPLRIIMCSMYFEIFRLGVVYAYDVLKTQGGVSLCLDSLQNASRTCEEFVQSEDLTASFFARASDACIFYTLTYAIDTVLAFSGYMSMYKHRMKHIWEHHIPGGIFTGLSALFHCRMSKRFTKRHDQVPTFLHLSSSCTCCCRTRKSSM